MVKKAIIPFILLMTLTANAQYGNRWQQHNRGNGRTGYRIEPKRDVSMAMVDSIDVFMRGCRHYFELGRWDNEGIMRITMPDNADSSFRRNNDRTRIVLGYPQSRMEYYLREDDCFEWEIVLHRRPDTNVFSFPIESRNLVFYYQDSIAIANDPMIDCPDSVYGSYAAYHATKRNNKYATGKAFHIYRPKIHDDRDTIWCDLNIDHGQLIITVPEEFLDHCRYPVTIDPTMGYTSEGAASGYWGKYLRAEKAVSGADADGCKIDSCCFYIADMINGPYNWQGALYSHDAINDEPDDSLASQKTSTSISTTGWKTSTAGWSDHSLEANTTYWLGSHNNSPYDSWIRAALDYSGGSHADNNNYDENDFPAFPVNFGAPTGENARLFSYYVWYSSEEGGEDISYVRRRQAAAAVQR
jgi:hypothetical protein